MSIRYIGLIYIILVLSGLSSVMSCKNDTTFAAENKTVIDTMFMNRNKVLKHEIDSLCPLDLNGTYKRAFDSIYALRIQMTEIELQKVKQEQ